MSDKLYNKIVSERLEFVDDVLVDMDNTVADFDAVVLDRLPRHVARTARLHFYIHEDYPEFKDEVLKIVGDPRFFYELPLVDHALVGWQRIIDSGFNPRFASSPYSANEQCILGKRSWINRIFVPEFGPHVLERAIIDKRKYNYPGSSLIDDKGGIDTGNGTAMWQHIAFDKMHNKDSHAKFRLHGWLDPSLPKILEEAKEDAIKNLRS